MTAIFIMIPFGLRFDPGANSGAVGRDVFQLNNEINSIKRITLSH
jgi:hypothetical protein